MPAAAVLRLAVARPQVIGARPRIELGRLVEGRGKVGTEVLCGRRHIQRAEQDDQQEKDGQLFHGRPSLACDLPQNKTKSGVLRVEITSKPKLLSQLSTFHSDQPTSLPGATSSAWSTVSSRSVPVPSSRAESSMPWDSSPIILRGFRLESRISVLPISFSGSV